MEDKREGHTDQTMKVLVIHNPTVEEDPAKVSIVIERVWKLNQGMCAVDGIDLCPQLWVSLKAQVHLRGFPESIFRTWRSKAAQEGPQPQK